MIRRTLSIFIVVACSALTIFAGGQDRKISPDGIWHEMSDAGLHRRQSQRPIIPNAYRAFSLNMDALKHLLNQAPMEFTEAARRGSVIMTLPMPDGTFARFSIVESPVMEAELAAKFPEIKTYVAQGIDDPTATMRFDLMPTGFHAMVLTTRGTVYVDPYAIGDTRNYISYFKSDLSRDGRVWECKFTGPDDGQDNGNTKKPETTEVINGSTLRTYRLALAATNEYTVVVGGNTVAGALAAQVLIINRVNSVYERELAIHMNIIANNNLIIYAADNLSCGGSCNAANDPYSNSNPSALLTQNQTTCDSVIGTANYDIGHVFSTGGGGVATFSSTCGAGTKARGETGLPTPVGDPFAIDFVAHEIGHQFGANHTFNGTTGNCGGGTRSAGSAYEPGSGVTIMAYAGICGAQDLSDHSIDTFSVKSLEEIVAFREGAGACGPATATGNTPPAVTGGSNLLTIPKGTPFALTASATDVNGDSLTYDWNQYDLGPASPPDTDADGQPRPIFRQYLPTIGGTRTFPSLQFIVNNANVPPTTTGGFLTGEILPSISRVMHFQVVVRDNRANGGGINTGGLFTLIVDGGSGPFNVTSPNTPTTALIGHVLNVTWNVAGTSGGMVGAANVNILLSTDGGNTFPTVLSSSTPNDGSEGVTIPNTPTSTARIKVEASIFFDISDTNFSIVNSKPADFDGDGKSDLSVFRPSNSVWYILRSSTDTIQVQQFGLSSDRPVPGEYDGDGKTDIAVYRPSNGVWYVLQSLTSSIVVKQLGNATDIPTEADYDGDGKTDFSVYRPSTGVWYYERSFDSVLISQPFGVSGDLPVPGDYNGDGRADIAVWRPSTGTWFTSLDPATNYGAVQFGINADRPVQADYDGDGKTDLAVFRNGIWYILGSTTGFRAVSFGIPGDIATPAEYDGDGKMDVAVFRPSIGVWYILASTLNDRGSNFVDTKFTRPWGQAGDKPLPSAYVPEQ